MKKILAIAVALLVIGVAVAQVRSPYKNIGAAMPSLRIIDRSMKAYTNDDINKAKNSFLVLFNPTCHHCMDMAKLMGTHKQDFANHTIFFVAAADMMPYLDYFFEQTGAAAFDNLVIGIDSADIITNLYQYGSLPQINIYDSTQTLVRMFAGETPLDSLLKYTH
jgi:hypothetical protein